MVDFFSWTLTSGKPARYPDKVENYRLLEKAQLNSLKINENKTVCNVLSPPMIKTFKIRFFFKIIKTSALAT